MIGGSSIVVGFGSATSLNVVELNADTVPVWDAIFHVEKESLHSNALTLLRKHASVMNVISDRLLVAFDGALRLQPRLRHCNCDNMLLNPLAMRAGERSQVLARITRFNRGQPHGTAASCALRTLVLCVEHSRCSSRSRQPQFGVLSSPASQPAAFDLKGSDAMTDVST